MMSEISNHMASEYYASDDEASEDSDHESSTRNGVGKVSTSHESRHKQRQYPFR